MIIIDTALKKRHQEKNPIRVGMVGAGFMARGIALQLTKYVKGFQLVAISNRSIDKARQAFVEAGLNDIKEVSRPDEIDECARLGIPCITEDPLILCDSQHIDVIVEVTGAVEFGARVVMRAISGKKHVVMMNAELDSTLGPILKYHADKQGVIVTNVDGDQPGVIMNLFRFVPVSYTHLTLPTTPYV